MAWDPLSGFTMAKATSKWSYHYAFNPPKNKYIRINRINNVWNLEINCNPATASTQSCVSLCIALFSPTGTYAVITLLWRPWSPLVVCRIPPQFMKLPFKGSITLWVCSLSLSWLVRFVDNLFLLFHIGLINWLPVIWPSCLALSGLNCTYQIRGVIYNCMF